MKVSDHWVRSPLLNISRACQVCHPYAESEIQARVDAIQDRTHALDEPLGGRAPRPARRDRRRPGRRARPRRSWREVLALQRKAQWRLDFVAAENSMGFHAPQETARVLAESIDYARQGQLAAKMLAMPAVPAHK